MTTYSSSELAAQPRGPSGQGPRFDTPIVPRNSISGRALIAVVAIMTFLASLTTGGVLLVYASASDWQADVAREITVQIRPTPGRDLDAATEKAVALTKGINGITAVQAMSKEESARLLEPWLGAGLTLDELPVPRMIVATIASGGKADIAQLRRILAQEVPGATVDDHRGWIERMRAMAGAAVAGGIGVLILVIAATVLSVSFATRGAMATNRPVIEVLHFIGAKNGFIAALFQRHFLLLGLQGGAIGGGVAMLLFALGSLAARWFTGSAAFEQSTALFGTFSIGVTGYIAVLAQIIAIGVVTAWTSRATVNITLEAID